MYHTDKNPLPVKTNSPIAENISSRGIAHPAVVQRSSEDKDWKKKIKDDEPKKKEAVKPVGTSTSVPEKKETIVTESKKEIVVQPETTTVTEVGEDDVVTLGKIQLAYEGRAKGIEHAKSLLGDAFTKLPKVVFIVDGSGLIQQIKNERQINRFDEVKSLFNQQQQFDIFLHSVRTKIKQVPHCISAYKAAPFFASYISKTKDTIDLKKSGIGSLTEQVKKKEEEKATAYKEWKKLSTLERKNQTHPKRVKWNNAIAAFDVAVEDLKKHNTSILDLEKLVVDAERKLKEALSNMELARQIIRDFPKEEERIGRQLDTCKFALAGFDDFLIHVQLRNKILPVQQENLAELDRIIAVLSDRQDEYISLNGSEDGLTYLSYKSQCEKLLLLKESYLSYTVDDIVREIDACNKEVGLAGIDLEKRPPLVPDRPQQRELIIGEKDKVVQSAESLKQLRKDMESLSPTARSKYGPLVDECIVKLEEIKKDLKAINTTGDPLKSIELIKLQLNKYRETEEKVEAIPDLQALIQDARIKRLATKDAEYANYIKQLLESSRVLDPENLQRELKKPVEKEKYVSRKMELEYLLTALTADKNALVQVGRMKKEQLAGRLKDAGFTLQSQAVLDSTVSEIEADGIIWLPDDVEAVQHKRTTSVNPLEGRVHGSMERTKPEFEKQLTEAANQLSGLTAQGSKWDTFHNRLPETPPEGEGLNRVVNLLLVNVPVPDESRLAEYEDVIRTVMSQSQSTARQPRSHYVEMIRINFNDGSLEYKRQNDHRYQIV